MFCIVAHSGAGLLSQNRMMQYRTLIGRSVDLGLFHYFFLLFTFVSYYAFIFVNYLFFQNCIIIY